MPETQASECARMIRRIKTAVGELGWKAAVLYSINYLAEKLGMQPPIYYYYLVSQPLSARMSLPRSLARNIEVREIVSDDAACAEMPVSIQVVQKRFDQRAMCLGAFKDSELIAYLWLSFGPYEEDEVRCRFIPQPEGRAVWDFDVYVYPRHRIGVGFVALWNETNELLRKRGIEHTCSRVSAFNSMSIRSHEKMGATIVGTAVFLAFRRIQFLHCSRRPYFHFSLRKSTRPTVYV